MTWGLLQALTPLGPPRPPQGCALIHPVSKLRAEPRAVWALWAQQGTKVPSDHSVPGRSQGKQVVTTLSRPGRTLRGCTGGETEAQTGSFSLWDMQPGNAELRWSPVSFSIRGSPPSLIGPWVLPHSPRGQGGCPPASGFGTSALGPYPALYSLGTGKGHVGSCWC